MLSSGGSGMMGRLVSVASYPLGILRPTSITRVAFRCLSLKDGAQS